MKIFFLRLVILFIGLSIAHLGVSFFLLADLGSDPFNVMIQGLFRTQQQLFSFEFATHGRIHMLVSFLIIVVLLFTDKSYIKTGTLICMFFGGPIIDFFNYFLEPIVKPFMNLPFRIFINIVGCTILAYGMTIVIKSKAGTGPNDLVALVLSEKSKMNFAPVRICVDVIFAAIGFALGGTLGIGTVICAFIVGPVAGFFLPYNEKLINRMIRKFDQ